MLKIDNLHASIPGREILKGLSLQVKPGEVHAIMGPNGAGKSTLGHILAGREGYDITAGSVLFEGRDLLALAPEERAAADTGVEVLDLQHQPTAPSSDTSSNFFASTANSIGSSRNTCLQKPSTISDTASSSPSPRERQ